MSRCLGLDRVEVGVGKGRLDTLVKDPEEGRRVCDVGGIFPASTAGEEADDTSPAISYELEPESPGAEKAPSL